MSRIAPVQISGSDTVEGLRQSVQTAMGRLVTQLNANQISVDLNLNNKRVTNVGRPSALHDAVTVEFLDAELAKNRKTIIQAVGSGGDSATETPVSPTDAPGVVTNVDVTYRYTDIADGLQEGSGDRFLELLVTYDQPSPIGTFKGVVAFIEYPDQSNAEWFALNSTTELNSSFPVAGNWTPIDCGRFPYDSADEVPVVIKQLEIPSVATTIRVYLVSYSDEITNQLVRAIDAGFSPTDTVDVAPPGTDVIGEEFCRNVTAFTCVTSTEIEGGTDITHFVCTFVPPSDPRWSGVRIVARYPPGTWVDGDDVVLGLFINSPTDSWFPTPEGVVPIKIFGVSYADRAATSDPADDSVNTIVDGFTPGVNVTIGTTLGTLDLGQAVTSSVGSALAVVAGVLGVQAGGVTEGLLGTFAVSADKIAAGAITATKIANLAVGTAAIADAAITTAKITNLAVTTALINTAAITSAKIGDAEVINAKIVTLDAAKITTGTLSAINIIGGTLTLNLNGVTTTIDNSLGSPAEYSGISIKQNSSSMETEFFPARIYMINSAGQNTVDIIGDLGDNPNIQLKDSAGATTFSVGVAFNEVRSIGYPFNATAGGVYKVSSLQVVAARKTGWTAASGTATRSGFTTSTVTLATLAEHVKALIDDLHSTAGHGLIGT